ncbi:NB-ARC domain-containing protein [Kribbella sp. NBC_01245]|uniref:AAA family ATPase n=1 Tax=Kribbella sp. NBC_01245 TaxID=2903578 RepID=UPI002E2E1C08|nr:AAA family ATPase [Kribbella sp. NBC_01245]
MQVNGVRRPAELPGLTPKLIGRSGEIHRLVDELAVPGAFRTVSGPAGAGKSALAVNVARDVAHHYPDGQLYVDLHARPPDARTVLARLLRSLGADPRPWTGLDELVACYRSATAGRRLLLVLDNADDTAQVLPLLPAGTSCSVLITSRLRLELPEAKRLHLAPLPEPDALALLHHLSGTGPVDAADARELVRLCDYLPLAIGIAAAKLAASCRWTSAKLVRHLRDDARRLDVLTDDTDGQRSVRESLLAGYHLVRRLPEGLEAARLFRLIGQREVYRIDARALARRTGFAETRSKALLELLADAQLLEPIAPGRYRMPALTRLLATELAHTDHP